MKRIAIIPARGGSKRIPNKNIKDFFGKPIIAYSIQAALDSGLYDEVMVSTDSESIKEVALRYGAKVPFMRSEGNSNDFATTVDVLLEVIECYRQGGHEFDAATCIYACAPFTSADLLTASFQLLDKGCDCVFPVLPYSHPIQRAVEVSEEGKVIPFFNADDTTRTQDFKHAFHDAGMFYTFDVLKLLVNRSLRTQDTLAIEIDELCAHDIDSENDWKLAELKYKMFVK
ncbi:pseudaminic acid cytidylyltransferase [Flavobacterium sp. DG1-102-2]|uniref:pseudaminic acid cytidylyltransferase n=1 Tax=Flavobacterium sp. DG1-102-2 TaxID=3081663 RepID=UPI002949F2D8|nr:pseudaminic acid cytidylyltransferase [Flavobacterium sp. DG1-102-2]MDV6168379.1 pseudaminic acid cytidylyltransferase [Flavobacterium sp. DG1-102-2]